MSRRSTGSDPCAPSRLVEWLYALGLRFYPPRFRHAYGAQMSEAFTAQYTRHAGSLPQLTRFLLREATDLARNATRQRFSPTPDPSHDPAPRGNAASMLESVLQDIRFAARALARRPGFTLVAAGILAVGIGANTAIFSVVDNVLLKSMPYPHAERLVIGWHPHEGQGLWNPSMSKPELVDYRERSNALDSISAFGYGASNIVVDGEPIPMWSTWIASDLLQTLGVEPVLGRAFTPEEHTEGNDQVVILNGRTWQRGFGADPDVIGTTVNLDGEPFTVVGVMPFDFQIPVDTKWPGRTGLILPLVDPQPSDRRDNTLAYFVGRLDEGVTLREAQAEFDGIGAQFQEEHPDFYPDTPGWSMQLVSLADETVGSVRPALTILLSAVAIVLLIACANVANLLLARAASRAHEVALRKALGAGRVRVARQVLTESLLLAVIAGAGGFMLAWWSLDLVTGLVPGNIPRLDEVQIDARVFAFSLALSVGTGLVFGLVPAWRSAGKGPARALRSAHGDGSPASNRLRTALVIAEAAIAALVLVGAGLLVRSFGELYLTDPGFTTHDVLTVRYSLDGSRVPDGRDAPRAMQQTADRLAELPGVDSAGFASNTPMWTTGGVARVAVEGRGDGEFAHIGTRVAGPGYFETMRIGLIQGRTFVRDDSENSQRVALINESTAAALWPGEDVLGKRLRFADATVPVAVTTPLASTDGPGGVTGNGVDEEPAPWLTVVGVIGDTLHNGLRTPPGTVVYVPYAQVVPSGFGVITYNSTKLRVTGDPADFVALVEAELQSMWPELPTTVRPLRDQFEDSLAAERFAMQVMGFFGVIALVLAALGIYSIIAYSVAERSTEIGIRIALGARPDAVVGMVMRAWMARALIGLGIGLAIAAGVSRVLESQLYEISTLDTATYVAAAVGLTIVSAAACYVPARRAARLDPLSAIRSG